MINLLTYAYEVSCRIRTDESPYSFLRFTPINWFPRSLRFSVNNYIRTNIRYSSFTKTATVANYQKSAYILYDLMRTPSHYSACGRAFSG